MRANKIILEVVMDKLKELRIKIGQLEEFAYNEVMNSRCSNELFNEIKKLWEFIEEAANK